MGWVLTEAISLNFFKFNEKLNETSWEKSHPKTLFKKNIYIFIFGYDKQIVWDFKRQPGNVTLWRFIENTGNCEINRKIEITVVSILLKFLHLEKRKITFWFHSPNIRSLSRNTLYMCVCRLTTHSVDVWKSNMY